MLLSGKRVLVALSGGPDSVALLHVLQTLERRGHLAVAGVAHFNHQLRGVEAEADERFCLDLAAMLRLPIEVGRCDVRALAEHDRRSLEELAERAGPAIDNARRFREARQLAEIGRAHV